MLIGLKAAVPVYTGYDGLRVISYERGLRLGIASSRAFATSSRHVLSHRARREADTELDEELVGDALFAPGNVCGRHFRDQLL